MNPTMQATTDVDAWGVQQMRDALDEAASIVREDTNRRTIRRMVADADHGLAAEALGKAGLSGVDPNLLLAYEAQRVDHFADCPAGAKFRVGQR